jgi:hypothetical protein
MFKVCSLGKQKFVVCSFEDENESYLVFQREQTDLPIYEYETIYDLRDKIQNIR